MHPIAKAYFQARLRGLDENWAAREAVIEADYQAWVALLDRMEELDNVDKRGHGYFNALKAHVRQHLPEGEL